MRGDFHPPAWVIAARSISRAAKSWVAPTRVEWPLIAATYRAGIQSTAPPVLKISETLPEFNAPPIRARPINRRKTAPSSHPRVLQPYFEPPQPSCATNTPLSLPHRIGFTAPYQRLAGCRSDGSQCLGARAPRVRRRRARVSYATQSMARSRSARSQSPALSMNSLMSFQFRDAPGPGGPRFPVPSSSIPTGRLRSSRDVKMRAVCTREIVANIALYGRRLSCRPSLGHRLNARTVCGYAGRNASPPIRSTPGISPRPLSARGNVLTE